MKKKWRFLPENNPIPELLKDEDYNKLKALKIIQPIFLRNHIIKRDWKQMKLEGFSRAAAEEYFMKKYGLGDSAVSKILNCKFFAQVTAKRQYLLNK